MIEKMINFRFTIFFSNVCFVFAGFAFYASIAFATSNVDPLIIEKNRMQQQIVEQESQRLENNKPSSSKTEFDIKTLLLVPEGQKCQMLKNIWLYGADQINTSARKKLFAPFMPQCQNNDGLALIARTLQTWYLQRGYITTRVSMKKLQSSLDKGNFEIWVSEGRIDQFLLAENTLFDKLRTRSAFPVIRGDILNIYDLDQGLEQLNRLFSQKFRMQIVPSSIPGYSNIKLLEKFSDSSYILDKSRGRHWGRHKLDYSYNNGGSNGTGKNLHNLTLTRENIIGLNDIFSLSYQRAVPFRSEVKDNETLRFNTSMPWGEWYFNASSYRGKTSQQISSTVVSRGDIRTQQVSINRLLKRGKNYKLGSLLKVDRNKRETFINNTQIGVQDRITSSINLGGIYTHYFPQAVLVSSLTYSRGRPWFGSYSNPSIEADADYSSYKLYTYYKRHVFVGSPYQLSLQTVLNSQYSSSFLFGENQFVVGGQYSIRGFKENILSYSSGWTISNDIEVPIGKFLKQTYDIDMIAPLNVKLIIDFGRGYDTEDGKQNMFAGGGIGASYTHRWFAINLTIAKAFRTPNDFEERESWITNINVNSSFSF